MVRSEEACGDDKFHEWNDSNPDADDSNVSCCNVVSYDPNTSLGRMCEWMQSRQSELSTKSHEKEHRRIHG